MKIKTNYKFLARVLIEERLKRFNSRLRLESIHNVEFDHFSGFTILRIVWVDTSGDTHIETWNRWNDEI